MEDGLQTELHSFRRGKAALADVLHKIDLVNAFLTRIQSLEKTSQMHTVAIAELQNQSKHFLTATSLQIAINQLSSQVQEAVSKKISDFEANFEERLRLFPMKAQIDSILTEKASTSVVSHLYQAVSSLKQQFEALNSSVFEAFKVEIRRSLATKLDISSANEVITNSSPLQSLLNRLQLTEIDLNPSNIQHESQKSQYETRGNAEIVKWVTGMQQEIDLMKENIREWKTDLMEKWEKIEKNEEEVKEIEEKSREKERKKGGKVGKRGEGEVEEGEEAGYAAVRGSERGFKEGSPLLKRLVRLETDLNAVILTVEYMKTRQKDRINEFAQRIQQLAEHGDVMSHEFAVLQSRLVSLEATHHRDVVTLGEELERLTGPMTDLLNTQALESSALHVEIQRHQEALKNFVFEHTVTPTSRQGVTAAIKTTPPPFISPRKLNLLERVQSASPAIRLRKRLRPGVLAKETGDESYSFPSPRVDNSISLERRRMGTSRGASTRRKANIEAMLPTQRHQLPD